MPHALAEGLLISCMNCHYNTHAVSMVRTEMTLHAAPDGWNIPAVRRHARQNERCCSTRVSVDVAECHVPNVGQSS